MLGFASPCPGKRPFMGAAASREGAGCRGHRLSLQCLIWCMREDLHGQVAFHASEEAGQARIGDYTWLPIAQSKEVEVLLLWG